MLDGSPPPYADQAGPECDKPDVLIAAELVPGPILLVAAGQDKVWPPAAMAGALSQRLREHGDLHGHALLEHPDAGHSLGYLIPELPAGVLPGDLSDQPRRPGGARRRVAAGRRVPAPTRAC